MGGTKPRGHWLMPDLPILRALTPWSSWIHGSLVLTFKIQSDHPDRRTCKYFGSLIRNEEYIVYSNTKLYSNGLCIHFKKERHQLL